MFSSTYIWTLILCHLNCRNDETRQPLSRKVPLPSSRINPYRMVIVLRLIVLSIFLHYRITNPVRNAYPLWLLSVICEIWFALSWILDQFPKWFPINRETYLDRLALRWSLFQFSSMSFKYKPNLFISLMFVTVPFTLTGMTGKVNHLSWLLLTFSSVQSTQWRSLLLLLPIPCYPFLLWITLWIRSLAMYLMMELQCWHLMH